MCADVGHSGINKIARKKSRGGNFAWGASAFGHFACASASWYVRVACASSWRPRPRGLLKQWCAIAMRQCLLYPLLLPSFCLFFWGHERPSIHISDHTAQGWANRECNSGAAAPAMSASCSMRGLLAEHHRSGWGCRLVWLIPLQLCLVPVYLTVLSLCS